MRQFPHPSCTPPSGFGTPVKQIARRFAATHRLFDPRLVHPLLTGDGGVLPSHLLGTIAVTTGTATIFPPLQGEGALCASSQCASGYHYTSNTTMRIHACDARTLTHRSHIATIGTARGYSPAGVYVAVAPWHDSTRDSHFSVPAASTACPKQP